MCEKARNAGTVTKTEKELVALGREHPDHFSVEKIRRVEGR
jgi:hypothetical protein